MTNLVEAKQAMFSDGKEGIVGNKNAFSLYNNSLGKCIYYQFDGLEYIDTTYVVSFKYKNYSSDEKLSYFNQSANNEVLRNTIKFSELSPTSNWKTHTKLIASEDGNLRLYFCNGFMSLFNKYGLDNQEPTDVNPQPSIGIKDISLYKVAYPNIVLYKKQKETTDIDNVVSFKKIDPVTYDVNLKKSSEPTSLIMRESYGKYWKLCDEKNKCLPFDDKSHFATAGFANAWYSEKGFGEKLKLYYYPQRWYTIGTIITLGSVLILIGGICIHILRKR